MVGKLRCSSELWATHADNIIKQLQLTDVGIVQYPKKYTYEELDILIVAESPLFTKPRHFWWPYPDGNGSMGDLETCTTWEELKIQLERLKQACEEHLAE